MEAKLASMGLKSPASPAVRQFARQSLGPGTVADAGSFLSPNSAMYDPNDPNAAAMLAQQRAKLKAQSHRISAPGTLGVMNHGGLSSEPLWAQATPESVEGSRRSPSPASQRPKSTGSDISLSAGNTANNLMRSPNVGNLGFDDQLSPMVGGNWSSMVNTPIVPMFGSSTNTVDDNGAPLSPKLDLGNASNKLASWGAAHQGTQQNAANQSNIVLDDAKKFRRSGRLPGQLGASGSGGMGNFGIDASQRRVSGGQQQNLQNQLAFQATLQQQQQQQRSPNLGNSVSANQTLLNAQQAALSAQNNWRTVNGLLTPNTNSPGANGGNLTPAEMANALMLQQQQQMMAAQLQLQQNLMAMSSMSGMMGGMPGMPGMLSPNMNQMGQAPMMNLMSPMGSLSPSMSGPKRSPRPGNDRSPGLRTPNSAASGAGAGTNPEDAVDPALLADVSAWLRSLRLHKCVVTSQLLDDVLLSAVTITDIPPISKARNGKTWSRWTTLLWRRKASLRSVLAGNVRLR